MKRSFFRKLIAAAAAALLLAAFCGCGGKPANDDSLKKVLGKGELVLGLDVEFPPMGFIDASGEIVGFDVDAAREVCSRLGVKLTLRGIDWDEKETLLADGTIDCIWNGLSVTPARAEAMELSDPYMNNELIFVVSGSSRARSQSDLKGGRVGVQVGSTALETLKGLDIYPDVMPMLYPNIMIAMQRLESGEVDAVLVDSVPAFYYIFSQEKQLFMLSGSLGEEKYAVGFRKGDVALRDKVQAILGEMKADGTLGGISNKWFGRDITTVK